MFVFVCAGCGAELTTPLSPVALPLHARQAFGNGLQLPVLMEPGTFAVDPEPWGPPWRRWEEIPPDEAAARGFHAPVHALSYGTSGGIVVAPGDTRGTLLIPGRRGGACCGLDGGDGPNTACASCGLPVATRIDDCSRWQATWLAPDAVRRLPTGSADADTAPLTWADLMAQRKGTPPVEPIATWGSPAGTGEWSWSPQWVAAAGLALAHLLVASEGRPVTVPDGLVTEVFQHALDGLLPTGPPARRAVLAGPGRPAPDGGADILLVPTHPQTGEPWAPAGTSDPPHLVPLPVGVWLWMAFPEPDLPVPTSGGIPDWVLRDDVPAQRADHPLRIDGVEFRYALARQPAVRSPWLRAILERLTTAGIR
ncbi:hypothetical protein ACWEQL_23750 [Kitasatospora sp. NPDC004240]